MIVSIVRIGGSKYYANFQWKSHIIYYCAKSQIIYYFLSDTVEN